MVYGYGTQTLVIKVAVSQGCFIPPDTDPHPHSTRNTRNDGVSVWGQPKQSKPRFYIRTVREPDMDELGHLTPEDDIFLDEDVLRDDYDPDRILERDDVLNRYLQMFSEVIRGKRPRNVFVYGPTGVGKTVGTHLVLDRVCEDAEGVDGVDVTAVQMECRDLNTSYQVAVSLVNVLRESTPRSSLPTTGYPEGDVFDMLFDELRDADTSHVLIALDEIDNIGTSDNVLYKLGRCNNRNSAKFVDPDNTKVGLVGITNDSTFRDSLDPRVKSTLCEHEIHFPPYDANELRTILENRAADAFHDGVLTDDVVPITAAFAAKRSGYARTALDLLYTAGDLARSGDDALVTEEHVRKAESEIQQGAIVSEIASLSPQGKLVAYTLLALSDQGELPAKMDAFYAWYEHAARLAESDTVTARTVRDLLNDLVINGVAKMEEVNRGQRGGRHYRYSLAAHPEMVADGLAEDDTITDLDDERGGVLF